MCLVFRFSPQRENSRVVLGFEVGLLGNCSVPRVWLYTPVVTSSLLTMTISGSASFPARASSRSVLSWRGQRSVLSWRGVLLRSYSSHRPSLAREDWWDQRECPWTRTDMWSLSTTRHARSSSFSWPADSSPSLVVEAPEISSLQVAITQQSRTWQNTATLAFTQALVGQIWLHIKTSLVLNLFRNTVITYLTGSPSPVSTPFI